MITQGETRCLMKRYNRILSKPNDIKREQLIDFIEDMKASYDYETFTDHITFHIDTIQNLYTSAYQQCCRAQMKKSTA